MCLKVSTQLSYGSSNKETHFKSIKLTQQMMSHLLTHQSKHKLPHPQRLMRYQCLSAINMILSRKYSKYVFHRICIKLIIRNQNNKKMRFMGFDFVNHFPMYHPDKLHTFRFLTVSLHVTLHTFSFLTNNERSIISINFWFLSRLTLMITLRSDIGLWL